MIDTDLETIAKTSSRQEFDIPNTKDAVANFFARLVNHTLDAKTRAPILDIGCDYGNFLLTYGSTRIVGLDIRRKPLKVMQVYASTPINVTQASALELPFKDGTFAAVTLWDVIEHVPQKTEIELLKEINRVLLAGSYLMLSTPLSTFRSILLDPAFTIRRHRHYSEQQITSLLSRSGFTVEEIMSKGDFRYSLSINFFYLRRWLIRRDNIVTTGIQRLLNRMAKDSLFSDSDGSYELVIVAKKRSS